MGEVIFAGRQSRAGVPSPDALASCLWPSCWSFSHSLWLHRSVLPVLILVLFLSELFQLTFLD